MLILSFMQDEESPFASGGTISEPKMTVSDVWEQLRNALHYRWRDFSARTCVKDLRQSRKLVLFIVFVALLLDNMLMTVIGKMPLFIAVYSVRSIHGYRN